MFACLEFDSGLPHGRLNHPPWQEPPLLWCNQKKTFARIGDEVLCGLKWL